MDGQGNVYVTDNKNFHIQKFDAAGHWLAPWSTVLSNWPHGVAVDRQGKVYVTIADNNSCIQKFTAIRTFIPVTSPQPGSSFIILMA